MIFNQNWQCVLTRLGSTHHATLPEQESSQLTIYSIASPRSSSIRWNGRWVFEILRAWSPLPKLSSYFLLLVPLVGRPQVLHAPHAGTWAEDGLLGPATGRCDSTIPVIVYIKLDHLHVVTAKSLNPIQLSVFAACRCRAALQKRTCEYTRPCSRGSYRN